jgi:hypothetical protein
MEDLKPIADGLDLDLADLQAKVRRKSLAAQVRSIRAEGELSPADLAFVDSHRDFFPELAVIQSHRASTRRTA